MRAVGAAQAKVCYTVTLFPQIHEFIFQINHFKTSILHIKHAENSKKKSKKHYI